MREPVLATRRLPPGDGYRITRLMRVEGGLHFIRGNSKPYFTITTWVHRLGFPNQCQSGGCDHESIERYWPGKYSDLIALHLSDIDGVPSSGEANGWYDLAGALGGASERYHRGNSPMNFPAVAPPDKPWKNYEHRNPTPDDCLRMFAEHCRVPLEQARDIRDRCKSAAVEHDFGIDWAPSREVWRSCYAAQHPRWKQEANACIARHDLKVFGDAWPVAA